MRSLILVGGLSSRMGIPKHLLILSNSGSNRQTEYPLLVHLLLCHHEFQSKLNQSTSNIHISTRDTEQQAKVERLLSSLNLPHNLHVHYLQDEYIDTGPVAGLLAAYAYEPTQSWLVSGCDYPLLSVSALNQLYESHTSEDAAITCFLNDDGFAEPLLAIWTPSSLRVMHEMAAAARNERRNLGPSQVIRALERLDAKDERAPLTNGNHVNPIKPMDSAWLINVNTPEEWYQIQNSIPTSYPTS